MIFAYLHQRGISGALATRVAHALNNHALVTKSENIWRLEQALSPWIMNEFSIDSTGQKRDCWIMSALVFSKGIFHQGEFKAYL